MTVVSELTSQFGVAAACQALAVPRSSFYRSRQVPFMNSTVGTCSDIFATFEMIIESSRPRSVSRNSIWSHC